jgi:hypothetical protein
MPATAPAASRVVATTDNVRPPLLTLDQLKADFAHVEKAVVDLEGEFAAIPPVLEDEEDLALTTALAGRLIKAAKRCEEIRVEQNRPYLDASNLLNAHFKHDLQARLNTAKGSLEKITTVFQRKKAAREQALRDEQAAAARKLADEAARKVVETVQSGDVPAATAAVKQADALTAFANKSAAAAAAPTSSMGLVKTESGTASLVDNWTFDELDLNTIDLNALRPFLTQSAIEQAIRAFIKSGRREIVGAHIFNDNKTRFRG